MCLLDSTSKIMAASECVHNAAFGPKVRKHQRTSDSNLLRHDFWNQAQTADWPSAHFISRRRQECHPIGIERCQRDAAGIFHGFLPTRTDSDRAEVQRWAATHEAPAKANADAAVDACAMTRQFGDVSYRGEGAINGISQHPAGIAVGKRGARSLRAPGRAHCLPAGTRARGECVGTLSFLGEKQVLAPIGSVVNRIVVRHGRGR